MQATNRSPHILICGYFGFGNIGDEAILAAMLAAFRRTDPNASFLALSGDPGRTAALHGIEAVAWREPGRLIDAVRRSDLVVVGGGGLFHDYWGTDPSVQLTRKDWGISYFTSAAFVGALENKPVVLSGIGAGPLLHEESRRLVRAACDVAVSVTVRDRESADLLERIGVDSGKIAVGADLAFLLPADGTARERSRPGNRIGVALRSWSIGLDRPWEPEVAAALDAVAEKTGAAIVFLPFQDLSGDLEDDRAVADRVRSRMAHASRATIEALATPDDARRQIRACDCLLGMRLHSLLFGLGEGVPVVALAYDPKIESFMRSVGLEADVIPLAAARREDVASRLAGAPKALPPEARSEIARAEEAASRAIRRAVDALGGRPRSGSFAPETAEVLELVRERMRQDRDEGGSGSAPEPAPAAPGSARVARRSVRPSDVLILPIIPWDFRFQRPQQLSMQFARHGHRVFYLSPDVYLPPESDPWQMTGRAPGIAELRLRAPGPESIYRERMSVEAVDAFEEALAAWKQDRGVDRLTVVVQIPYWTSLAFRLRAHMAATVVYDCMDEWTNFPGIDAEVLGFEPALVREADLTVVSSSRLAEKWSPTARRLVLARNGIDLAHYVARYGPGHALSGVPRPILGYFGALASWLDVDLLEKLAIRFPNASIVLAGGQFDVDVSRLERLPNVVLLGQRPYGEIPEILWRFDVCLIPFLRNAITEATDPVKFYEYCFSGKPVVATEMPELRRFAGLCAIASSHEEFLEMTARALEEGSDDPVRIRRRSIAAENDWDRRYGQIAAAVAEAENARFASVERPVLDELEQVLVTTSRDRDRAQSELDRLRPQFDAARSELDKIHESRLWRIAAAYWAVRHALRRKSPAPPAPSLPPGSGAQSGEPRAEAASVLPHPPAPAPEPARHDVVCLPIVDWDFRFQRPQQLMSRFAEAGHRVFYVSLQFRRSGPPWQLVEKRPNVYEISLLGPHVNVYRQPLRAAGRDLLFASLDAARRDLSISLSAICVQLPFWWPLARRLHEERGWPIFYDCMDHHAGFSTNRGKMLEQERELLRGAGLVVASSRSLEEAARRENGNVLLLRNACDYEHFAGAFRPGPHGDRPVVGYYGAIADWFDADLVAALASRRPDWDFVLVGSTFSADVSRLSKLPNVSLPGEKPYAEIPGWLARFDVAIIPFKRTPLTEATNPVKAYEIFAAGKPLVAVPLPEVAAMAPHARLASTAEEFEREIESALADPAAGAAARRDFAHDNTWESRFDALAPAVAALFPKISVVVVTFGNRDLNVACLESVYRRTQWPNLEVIVVDNASDDGTPEYLRRAEREYPGLKVILNERNLGFAAANNQGLREAAGDYLVLLNNDTIVSRGWLPALVRHLHRDPSIGLVGAVTNAIGNEAMIPVGYERIEEMPAWAQRWMQEHDGETFDIPMLAMFCVAMRRSVHAQIGPLDERFGVGMFEDDDYSRRIHAAGLRTVCARDSFVHHWMKASFRRLPPEEYQRLFETNRRLFEEKWGVAWEPHRGAPPAPGTPRETTAAD